MRELGASAFKEMRRWEQRWPRATPVTGKTEDPRPHADPPRPCQPDFAGPKGSLGQDRSEPAAERACVPAGTRMELSKQGTQRGTQRGHSGGHSRGQGSTPGCLSTRLPGAQRTVGRQVPSPRHLCETSEEELRALNHVFEKTHQESEIQKVLLGPARPPAASAPGESACFQAGFQRRTEQNHLLPLASCPSSIPPAPPHLPTCLFPPAHLPTCAPAHLHACPSTAPQTCPARWR